MFYIESNGFAATAFLAQALSNIEGMNCFHGTRAIPEGLPLGSPKDLEAGPFVEKIHELEQQQGIITGAIHGKFDMAISPCLAKYSAPYAVAVREPVARIRSAHSWAKGKFDRGEFFPISPKALAIAYQVGSVDARFDDVLFAFSLLHILEYDSWVFNNRTAFSRVFQMEKYTVDKKYFAEMVVFLSEGKCNVKGEELEKIFTGEKVNAHAGEEEVSASEVYLAMPENQQAMLMQIFRGNPVFKELYQFFGYDVDWLY